MVRPADVNGSAVTGYEIRYSTAAITAANWSSATLTPNVLAPKAAGQAETFTIIGLQPSTTYYFAIKGIDEIGNVAGISNVATGTTPALTDMPVVTTVTFVDKTGVASANYPVNGRIAGQVLHEALDRRRHRRRSRPWDAAVITHDTDCNG